MQNFAEELATTLAVLAPFMLLGFVVAGLLHALVPRSLFVRAMGGSGIGPIARASLVGMPLPLCSCSVIPVATELRRQGAGRGATTAFMVSTPETGVDSISTSIAVLNPVLVLARPIAAVVTALLTGLAVERFSAQPEAAPAKTGSCCHHGGSAVKGGPRGLIGGLRYAFMDLLGEIAPYLLPALLLTALLGSIIRPAAMTDLAVADWLQRLILLAAGIPVYVCATSATPVAAAMIVAGVSPGAALVFLLAGPATNLVTISAVRSSLGGRAALVYVSVVAAASYAFGSLLDLFWTDLAGGTAKAHLHHEHLTWWHWTAAVVLGSLVLFHVARKLRRKLAS